MNRKWILSTMLIIVLFHIAHPMYGAEGLERFSFKLTGGFGYSKCGDFENVVVNGVDRYLKERAEFLGHTKEGALDWKYWSPNLGFELILGLTQNIGVGIGVEFHNTRLSDSCETRFLSYEILTAEFDLDYRIVPITLSAYYFLPVTEKISAVFKAGASLIPSPAMATTSPFCCKVSIILILCLGSTRA